MRTRKHVDGESMKLARSKIVHDTPCGKAGYTSRKIAAAIAARSRKSSGELIEAYRCKRGCHLWHVGHPPGWRAQEAERARWAS